MLFLPKSHEQTTTEMAAKKRCSVVPFDRISELPNDIAQSILMLLPLRDMARTSVLSKHWRYQWVKVPQLRFEDDSNYLVSKEEKYRYNGKRVFEILLKHEGPILSFYLNMRAWPTCTEVDSIIPFLSGNGIQKLSLLMPNNTAEIYKLSSSMLSSLNLQSLALSSCVLQLSPFLAFKNLAKLILAKVELEPSVSISSCPVLEILVLHEIINDVELLNIDAPSLKHLHLKCKLTRIGTLSTPVLKVLWVYGQPGFYTGKCSSDSILLSMPLLEELSLNNSFLKVLASDELPKLLNNLRILEFSGVDLCNMEDLPYALWLIRSSPNIRKLSFYLLRPMESLVEAELYLKMQDRSKYSLLQLLEVKMILIDKKKIDVGLVIEFSKFLLDMSPALEILSIGPHLKHIGGDTYKKLFEMACAPRASKVRIVCGDLESVKVTLA